MKKFLILGVAAVFALAACTAPASNSGASDGASTQASAGDTDGNGGQTETLKIGATINPAAEILQHLIDTGKAEDAGLKIEIQEFSDYTTPNQALADGSLDANLFQNTTFLGRFVDANPKDKLVSLGPVYFPPLGLYSKTVKQVSEIKDGATIAIPNDPSNGSRALELLEHEGLLKLEDGAVSVDQIAENPKNLDIKELEPSTLPAALSDVDAAVVNFNFAYGAGLTDNAKIVVEPYKEKWYNVLATREELKDDKRITTLYKLLTDEETKEWIDTEWKGIIYPVP